MKHTFRTYTDYTNHLKKESEKYHKLFESALIVAAMSFVLTVCLAIFVNFGFLIATVIISLIANGVASHLHEGYREYKFTHDIISRARWLDNVEAVLIGGPESISLYPNDKTDTHTFVICNLPDNRCSRGLYYIPQESDRVPIDRPDENSFSISKVKVLRQATKSVAYFENEVRVNDHQVKSSNATYKYPFLVYYWPKELRGVFIDDLSKIYNADILNPKAKGDE